MAMRVATSKAIILVCLLPLLAVGFTDAYILRFWDWR